jgi:hypothetical protein
MNEIMRLSRIRKRKDMEKKDMETVKNNQIKINNSISQVNIGIKNLVSRVEYIENRV